MSKAKTKVAKIVIQIDGKELELSPKQAKDLRDVLCEMYGGNDTVEHIYTDRYRQWQHPYWTYTVANGAIGMQADTTTTTAYNAITDTVFLSANEGTA
jgi:hypothetical protein